jgi:site-specific recombinase XerD
MGTICLKEIKNYITFKQTLDMFLEDLKITGRSPYTIKTYKNNLEKFYRYLCKYYNYQVYIEDITADDFERYLKVECDNEHYSSSYRFNVVMAFKVFTSYCYKKGYCKENVGKQIRQVVLREKEKESLTFIEIEKLFKAINHPVVLVAVMIMYYAGLRINECISIKNEDVDLENNYIIVKGSKTEKTRKIPMNDKLRAVIEEYIKEYGVNKKSDRFIATRTGKLSPNYTNLIIKKAAKEAGIKKKVTCHTLRHSCASNLISKRVDISQVQKILGHTNIKSTLRYIHSNIEELRETINLVN